MRPAATLSMRMRLSFRGWGSKGVLCLSTDVHRHACNVQSIKEIATRRNVRHRVEMINQDPPATCSQEVCDLDCTVGRLVSNTIPCHVKST